MQTGVATWLTPLIRRIVAPNPSAMTGPGTNSYLLGRGSGLILVDPGPMIESHIAALLASVYPGERIAKIIVTHAHLDHSAAAPRLSALTGAQVLAFGDATSGRSPTMRQLAKMRLSGGGEGIDTRFRPDTDLVDGARVCVETVSAQIIHTPGHMGGHICVAVEDVILSGDHVMAWSSSLISPPDGDMGAYMASLRRLAALQWSLMLPGHGEIVTKVAARIDALYNHRLAREAAIVEALALGPSTVKSLTSAIYTDTPTTLIPAARRNVLAHVIDLMERNMAQTPEIPDMKAIFTRRPPNP